MAIPGIPAVHQRGDVALSIADRIRKLRRWLVGPDRVELMNDGQRWSAQVVRADWDGANLDVDGRFGDQAEAVT